MPDKFSLDNPVERIREFQRKGWKVLEIGERLFEFQSPRGLTYGRAYFDPKHPDLVPLEELVGEIPAIDLKAEYFSRLYLEYWKSTPSREML